MICSIDFGSSVIRSLFPNPEAPERLCLSSTRSEYTIVPDTDVHRKTLFGQGVPFAVCEGALLVIGNDAIRARWMSRLPASPLLSEGRIPQSDAPARQILYELTQAMLPPLTTHRGICVMTVPGAGQGEAVAGLNEEFLTRLVRMKGYTPIVIGAAEAAMLGACLDSLFTGVSVVIGAETVSWCIARRGLVLANESFATGTRWIDMEIARRFGVQVWDAEGRVFLDTDQAVSWRIQSAPNLRSPRDDQETALSGLFGVLIRKISESITGAMETVDIGLRPLQAIPVMVSGGGALTAGLPEMLHASLLECEARSHQYSVARTTSPELAVVRGAYVYGELETGPGCAEIAA
jgi:hypothetical protein